MTLSSVPAAGAWLKSRNILVPEDWLDACVDWITEENQVFNIVELTTCSSKILRMKVQYGLDSDFKVACLSL